MGVRFPYNRRIILDVSVMKKFHIKALGLYCAAEIIATLVLISINQFFATQVKDAVNWILMCFSILIAIFGISFYSRSGVKDKNIVMLVIILVLAIINVSLSVYFTNT